MCIFLSKKVDDFFSRRPQRGPYFWHILGRQQQVQFFPVKNHSVDNGGMAPYLRPYVPTKPIFFRKKSTQSTIGGMPPGALGYAPVTR